MHELDYEFLQIQNEGQKYGYVLRDFKKEWLGVAIDSFQRPTLIYCKNTDEFIIQVPLIITKGVQYVPFIYKNLKTELFA